jgi:hypothetical protein
MWLIMASFLACFNIGKAKDEFGNDLEFDDSFNEFGVVMYVQILRSQLGTKLCLFRHKKPFKCSITPRSGLARHLVESSANH